MDGRLKKVKEVYWAMEQFQNNLSTPTCLYGIPQKLNTFGWTALQYLSIQPIYLQILRRQYCLLKTAHGRTLPSIASFRDYSCLKLSIPSLSVLSDLVEIGQQSSCTLLPACLEAT